MAEVGRPLDLWQQLFVMDALAVRPDGMWAAFEAALFVPRQNGKGGATEAIELAGLFLFHDQLIMHSAHLFKTAKNAFQRLVDIIDGSDWLTRRVKQLVRARGDEAIILTPAAGGGQLMCFSRTMGSGRGFTGDKTVFDEAAYLTIEQYAAATPTLATVSNPQIIYTGTPPDEDVGPMPENAMIPSVRARGHAGGSRITLHEYSPPKKFDRNDREVWYATNPALGIRIQEWFLAKQMENFTAAGKPSKFDTEHLNVWPDDEAAQWQVITEAQFTTAKDPTSAALDPVALSVYVTPDRRTTCIAAAGARADGDLSFGVYAHSAGTDWVPATVVAAVRDLNPCRLVIDKAGAGANLVVEVEQALRAAELAIEVTTMTSGEVGQAYGMVHDALTRTGDVPAWRLWHRGQPEMTAAVAGAVTRSLGREGTTWDTLATSADLSPIIAGTNAVWGYVTRPDDQQFFGAWR